MVRDASEGEVEMPFCQLPNQNTVATGAVVIAAG